MYCYLYTYIECKVINMNLAKHVKIAKHVKLVDHVKIAKHVKIS